MPLRIRCPACETINTVDEEKRGKRVRCRECDEPIRVPPAKEDEGIQDGRKVKTRPAPEADGGDDEDLSQEEERPRKKKKKKAGGNKTTLWILLGGGAALVFLLLCGGGTLIFLAVNNPEPGRGHGAKDGRQRHAHDNIQNRGVIARGKVILDKRDMLTEADPPDPTPDLAEVDARMKVHLVVLQPGKNYVFSLKSDDFDPYLRLESPTGVRLAEDDDGGNDLNARIVFRPTQPGRHRVIATAWDGDIGAYHLHIQEVE